MGVLQTPGVSEEVSSLLPKVRTDPFFRHLAAWPFTLYSVKLESKFAQEKDYYAHLTRKLKNALKKSRNRIYYVKVSLLKSEVLKRGSIKLLVRDIRKNVVYKAFIFDVSQDQGDSDISTGNSHHFMAVMRARYRWMSKIISDFVELNFLCIIRPILVSDRQLNFMVGLLINESLRRGFNDEIIFRYGIPGMEGASIQIACEGPHLLQMWSLSNQLKNEDVLTDECVAKFTRAVQEHTEIVYGINLAEYSLKEASIMGLRVSQQASLVLNIFSSGILFVLLNFLQDNFQNCRFPFKGP